MTLWVVGNKNHNKVNNKYTIQRESAYLIVFFTPKSELKLSRNPVSPDRSSFICC
jgi:hypothetical protein